MAKEVAGGEGGIIRGRRLFKYFRQREAINRGTAIIRENEVKRFSLSLDLQFSFTILCVIAQPFY